MLTPELDARFRAAALAEGLVDVRYDVVGSPVGDLFLAATERGLCRISYRVEGQDEELARSFGVRVLRLPLDTVRRELDEYFEGRRRTFDLPLDLRVAPSTRRCCTSSRACRTAAPTRTAPWPPGSGGRRRHARSAR